MDFKPYWRFVWMTVVGAVALISGVFSVIREVIGIYSVNPATPSSFWRWAGIAFIISAATLYVAEHKARVAAEKALRDSEQNSRRKKENRIQFARLMEEGKSLETACGIAQNAAEITNWLSARQEWKERIVATLKAAEMQIDAIAFSHAADNPSNSVVGPYTHIPETKRLYWIELAMYRNKLQEIVERNNLWLLR